MSPVRQRVARPNVQTTVVVNKSTLARAGCTAVALTIGLPSHAFAHGEQALVFPAATLSLILLTTIVLLSWGDEWRHKPMLVMTLFGVHVMLWFVPVADLASAAGQMFLVLIAVPVAAAVAVHAIVNRRWRRTDKSNGA